MSTAETVEVSVADIDVITSYGSNRTPTIASSRANSMGVSLALDAGAGTTQLVFKAQVKINNVWVDLYRDKDGTFEIEEYIIPVVPSGLSQTFAFRLAGDAMRDIRLDFKSVGGTLTVKSVHIVREQDHIKS